MMIRRADHDDFHGCLDIVPRAWRSSGFDARPGARLLGDHAPVAIEEPDDKLRPKCVGEQLMRKAIKWAFAARARRVFADVADDALGRTSRKGSERVGEIEHMHAEGLTFEIHSRKAGPVNLDAP